MILFSTIMRTKIAKVFLHGKFLRCLALEGIEGRETRRRESGHFPIIGVALALVMIALLLYAAPEINIHAFALEVLKVK